MINFDQKGHAFSFFEAIYKLTQSWKFDEA